VASDEGAGEMDQRAVVRRLLLPPHQDTADAVQPTAGPFHRPTARADTARGCSRASPGAAGGRCGARPRRALPRTTPRPSTSRLRCVPRLPRSVGVRPVFSATERRFRQRPVHGVRRPPELLQVVVLLPPQRAELFEHTRLRPFLETAVGGAAGAGAGGAQRIPRAARPQNEQDHVHGAAVSDTGTMAAEWVRGP
jgi:hypothetical protein